MTSSSTSAEATLLYATPPMGDLTEHLGELRKCIENFGETVAETRSVVGEHVLLHCSAVQVLLAYCGVPFDIKLFKGATRPILDPEAEAHAFEMLQNHQASVTVLVAERPGAFFAPKAEQNQRLCWEIADLVAEETHADLLYWCETDTLYTAEEFADVVPAAVKERPEPRLVAEAIPTVPFMADSLNLDFLDLDGGRSAR